MPRKSAAPEPVKLEPIETNYDVPKAEWRSRCVGFNNTLYDLQTDHFYALGTLEVNMLLREKPLGRYLRGLYQPGENDLANESVKARRSVQGKLVDLLLNVTTMDQMLDLHQRMLTLYGAFGAYEDGKNGEQLQRISKSVLDEIRSDEAFDLRVASLLRLYERGVHLNMRPMQYCAFTQLMFICYQTSFVELRDLIRRGTLPPLPSRKEYERDFRSQSLNFALALCAEVYIVHFWWKRRNDRERRLSFAGIFFFGYEQAQKSLPRVEKVLPSGEKRFVPARNAEPVRNSRDFVDEYVLYERVTRLNRVRALYSQLRCRVRQVEEGEFGNLPVKLRPLMPLPAPKAKASKQAKESEAKREAAPTAATRSSSSFSPPPAADAVTKRAESSRHTRRSSDTDSEATDSESDTESNSQGGKEEMRQNDVKAELRQSDVRVETRQSNVAATTTRLSIGTAFAVELARGAWDVAPSGVQQASIEDVLEYAREARESLTRQGQSVLGRECAPAAHPEEADRILHDALACSSLGTLQRMSDSVLARLGVMGRGAAPHQGAAVPHSLSTAMVDACMRNGALVRAIALLTELIDSAFNAASMNSDAANKEGSAVRKARLERLTETRRRLFAVLVRAFYLLFACGVSLEALDTTVNMTESKCTQRQAHNPLLQDAPSIDVLAKKLAPWRHHLFRSLAKGEKPDEAIYKYFLRPQKD